MDNERYIEILVNKILRDAKNDTWLDFSDICLLISNRLKIVQQEHTSMILSNSIKKDILNPEITCTECKQDAAQ